MLDTPLTELGINQARELGAAIHLLPVKPSRIYHSPLQRAKHTAEYVNEFLGLDMVEIDSLREHIFGDWEEVSWDAIRSLVEQGVNPPNGETYHEFDSRIRGALNHIHADDHPAPPLLVCHGGVFHSIGRMYGHKIGEVSNCALFHFDPAPYQAHFPWNITVFSLCPEQTLKTEIYSPAP